jgi:hypothetical protein
MKSEESGCAGAPPEFSCQAPEEKAEQQSVDDVQR